MQPEDKPVSHWAWDADIERGCSTVRMPHWALIVATFLALYGLIQSVKDIFAAIIAL